ncbi:hypothetical protein I3760_04G171900 [Carya illinoinensis]|nr:hypothetical protein I3760_04G171900 [Carya illinoinensis]
MELQLGLALPSNPNQGFDLNFYGCESKEGMVSDSCYVSSYPDTNDINDKKRGFDQTSSENATDSASSVPRTLSLLLWNNHPNEEDDYPKDLENHSFTPKEDDGVGDGLVGWPPVKYSWRNKRICDENNRAVVENGYGCGGRGSNSTYVKVNMEGIPIARKIDLSLHQSFETLTETLMDMFGQWWSETGQKDSNEYKLAYQDREGDWLFTQDVSWRTFIRSVQRLILLKSSG